MDYKVLIKVGQATSQSDTSFNFAPAAEISNLLFIENMEVTATLSLPRKQSSTLFTPNSCNDKRTTALTAVSVLHNPPLLHPRALPVLHQQQKPLHIQADKSSGHLE